MDTERYWLPKVKDTQIVESRYGNASNGSRPGLGSTPKLSRIRAGTGLKNGRKSTT